MKVKNIKGCRRGCSCLCVFSLAVMSRNWGGRGASTEVIGRDCSTMERCTTRALAQNMEIVLLFNFGIREQQCC